MNDLDLYLQGHPILVGHCAVLNLEPEIIAQEHLTMGQIPFENGRL